jgi:hypothetical protein
VSSSNVRASSRVRGSSASIFCGVKNGSSVWRYGVSSGGSMSSGINGRSVPNDGRIIEGATEKVSQSCSAAWMSS